MFFMISVHSYVIKVKKVPKVVLTDVIFLRDNIVLTIFDSRSSLDKGLFNFSFNGQFTIVWKGFPSLQRE